MFAFLRFTGRFRFCPIRIIITDASKVWGNDSFNFGSSEKKVRVAMNELLSIYLRTMLAVRSKLITLALFSADNE